MVSFGLTLKPEGSVRSCFTFLISFLSFQVLVLRLRSFPTSSSQTAPFMICAQNLKSSAEVPASSNLVHQWSVNAMPGAPAHHGQLK